MKSLKLLILAILMTVGGATTPVQATVTTTVNVTSVCTASANWAPCINSTLTSMAATGGTLYFPCGNYPTTQSIVIPAGLIELQGSGRCTTISGTGSFDTIYLSGTVTAQYYTNKINNLHMVEDNKTGGYSINALNVAQLQLVNLYIDHPWCGPHIHNFNDAIVEHVVVYNAIGNTRGMGCQAFLLTGGGTGDTGRSDVITFKDFIVSGNSLVDRTNSHHGLIIDGFVNTVNAVKMYLTAVDGHGLWIRNAIGASQIPQFGTFYGLESDYNYGAAIFIQQGSVFHFTDPMVNGSLSLSNIVLASGVSRISIEGGFSSNANQAGIDSFATQVAVANMDLVCNSSHDQGGTAGVWPGIVLESPTRMATLTGNKSGCPAAPSYQKYGILVNAGADQYTITTNALENNSLGGFSGASGTASKVVANNAQ